MEQLNIPRSTKQPQLQLENFRRLFNVRSFENLTELNLKDQIITLDILHLLTTSKYSKNLVLIDLSQSKFERELDFEEQFQNARFLQSLRFLLLPTHDINVLYNIKAANLKLLEVLNSFLKATRQDTSDQYVVHFIQSSYLQSITREFANLCNIEWTHKKNSLYQKTVQSIKFIEIASQKHEKLQNVIMKGIVPSDQMKITQMFFSLKFLAQHINIEDLAFLQELITSYPLIEVKLGRDVTYSLPTVELTLSNQLLNKLQIFAMKASSENLVKFMKNQNLAKAFQGIELQAIQLQWKNQTA